MAADSKRAFNAQRKDDSFVKLNTRRPTPQENDGADMEFSSVFNRSLMSGCPTRVKMARSMREKGLLEPKDEIRIGELRDLVQKIDKKLKRFPADEATLTQAQKDDRAALERDRLKHMAEFSSIRNDIDSLFAHTADVKADDAQRNYLVACVTEYGDGPKKGERVWASVDDLLNSDDGGLVERATYEFMMIQNGVPSDGDRLFKREPKPVVADEADEGEGEEGQAEDVADTSAADAPAVDAPAGDQEALAVDAGTTDAPAVTSEPIKL